MDRSSMNLMPIVIGDYRSVFIHFSSWHISEAQKVSGGTKPVNKRKTSIIAKLKNLMMLECVEWIQDGW